MTDDDDRQVWDALKDLAKERQAARRAKIPEHLRAVERAGLRLHQFSDEHYLVNGAFDWWPSTGRWKARRGGKRGFGVESLVRAATALP